MRQPIVAGRFYSGTDQGCRAHLQRIDAHAEYDAAGGARPVAAVVPHAGWDCSGRVAMKVYRAVESKVAPETTFILFGAVHSFGVPRASVYARGGGETPLGPLLVDQELAEQLLSGARGLLIDDSGAHLSEHSLEVQLPMLRYIFGDVRIVPIAVPPRADCAEVGRHVARIVRASGRPAFVVGTTDLTHYGEAGYDFAPRGPGRPGLEWVKTENDPRIIELMKSLRAEEIVREAQQRKNACGAGAVAATVAAARELGSPGGQVIEYTTSYDVLRDQVYGDQVGDFVGYVGMVF
jgi:MEMO1 family protein